MNRTEIAAAFAGGKALVIYLMAGDPSMEKTREYIKAAAGAGADLIEIGVPFSDPVAEGEIIQKASQRALASGASLDQIFGMTASLKGEVSTPLLLMTYVNPVFNYGYDDFFAKCAACGISGVILPDLPFEEHGEVLAFSERSGTDLISLIAPSSGERIARIAKGARGYVYLVSSMGVTGPRSEITTDIAAMTREIRKHTGIPVAVGFGVQRPEQAAALSKHADGVIIGSAVVDIIARHGGGAAPALADYVGAVKGAMLG